MCPTKSPDLVTTARQLLAVAELRFGRCVRPIDELCVTQTGAPEIWFEFRESLIKATIRIHPNIDENQRWFQLSQEVVHCLSIVPPEEVTYLEEGLTQAF